MGPESGRRRVKESQRRILQCTAWQLEAQRSHVRSALHLTSPLRCKGLPSRPKYRYRRAADIEDGVRPGLSAEEAAAAHSGVLRG